MRRIAAAALLLLAIAAPGCGDSEDEVSAAQDNGPFFGISPSDAPTEADLTRMANGGIGTYHVSLTWTLIEGAEGSYDWASFDQLVGELARAGLEPLPYVYGTPLSYAELPSEAPADEETLDAWEAFLEAAAERYGPDGEFWREFTEANPDVEPQPVRVWEIWNEPNSSLFWKPRPDPEAYAELLERSAEAIGGVDPEAEIMSGGMFATPNSPDSIESYDFLAELYERGAEDAIDIVGVHPYSPRVRGDLGVIDQVERTRETIDEAGDDAAMWVTELGWGSDPDVPSDIAKTPDEQAALLSESIGLLQDDAEELDLRGIVWYTWRDFEESVSGCGWCLSAGLLDADRDSKPAWIAFTELSGGTP